VLNDLADDFVQQVTRHILWRRWCSHLSLLVFKVREYQNSRLGEEVELTRYLTFAGDRALVCAMLRSRRSSRSIVIRRALAAMIRLLGVSSDQHWIRTSDFEVRRRVR